MYVTIETYIHPDFHCNLIRKESLLKRNIPEPSAEEVSETPIWGSENRELAWFWVQENEVSETDGAEEGFALCPGNSSEGTWEASPPGDQWTGSPKEEQEEASCSSWKAD